MNPARSPRPAGYPASCQLTCRDSILSTDTFKRKSVRYGSLTADDRPRRNARRKHGAALWLTVCGILLSAAGAGAQNAAPVPPVETSSADLPFAFDGPLPPVSPEVVARDQSGRVTIRAVRLTSPMRLDGRLDEALYSDVPSISDFIQQEPHEGSAATEKTETWLLFDADHVYVSFRCWDSAPARMVANEMRRDDMQHLSERPHRVRVRHLLRSPQRRRVRHQSRSAAGWTARSPTSASSTGTGIRSGISRSANSKGAGRRRRRSRSSRCDTGRGAIRSGASTCGASTAGRTNCRYLTRIPSALSGTGNLPGVAGGDARRIRGAGRVEEPRDQAVRDLEPDERHGGEAAISNDLGGDIGLDVKYGITQNLTADFTYNTDFAQVEADEQQVNLTRFSLFFPEKREFFLENQGTFTFGGAGSWPAAGADDGLSTRRRSCSTAGASGSSKVARCRSRPADASPGGSGATASGVLNIQTDDEPAVRLAGDELLGRARQARHAAPEQHRH